MRFEVPGFVGGAIAAGIKEKGRKDLAVIFSEVPACAAGVFTKNRVQAAPVLFDKERIRPGMAQAIVANSGNANACTGPKGLEDAQTMARSTAKALGISEDLVLVASTGVIGQPLNVPAIEAALPMLVRQLKPAGLMDVAKAVMTTDTFAKATSKQVEIHGETFTVMAVAKGAGMIRPDMATMLCFVCTDMGALPGLLQEALGKAVANAFNAITVDGDTSTNDMVLILANGLSGLQLETPSCLQAFQETLNEVLLTLALQIIRDGEGATKLVNVVVKGAASEDDARKIAYAVAESPLVKTAMFGQDANWGRIMAAAGRAGAALEADAVDIFFDHVQIVKAGQGCGPQAEDRGADVLKQDHFTITLDLCLGQSTATVHTCDLSTDYVKINADYRT